MSSRDLAKFTAVRRYASLVCIILEAWATLTDEVIDLHERILGSLFSRAKRRPNDFSKRESLFRAS